MNTDKILTGWNTWDTYSATTYVHMPEGYGVRIGLKEYLRGQYLQYPNIGRLGETDEKIRPGLHAYDGSYTELELEWRRIALKIQTAVRDDSLIIRIEPVSNTTRFIPSIVLEGVVLWNMPAVCRKDGQGIVWDAGGKTKRLQLISGTQNDPNIPSPACIVLKHISSYSVLSDFLNPAFLLNYKYSEMHVPCFLNMAHYIQTL